MAAEIDSARAAEFLHARERMREIAQANRVQQEVRSSASTNFLAFTRYTKLEYDAGWFGEDLHAALERFLERVVLRQSPRFLLCAPPRHGKSEAASRRFPAYALGRYPWLEIILWSYAASLAEDMNEDVQSIMDGEEYRTVFPDVRIPRPGEGGSGGKRNRQETHVIGTGGRLRAAGVGGGVTGKGSHILLVDDPFKDDQDSGSKTQRDKVWNRYVSTAYTRLAPGGGVLVIQTRWHEDDLAGRLEEASKRAAASGDEHADQFEVIRFPAIAEGDEEHRKEGEALHPARYDLKALRKIESTLGSYYWSALYQQRPAPAEGDVFRTSWWRYWRALPQIQLVKIYADTALKEKEANDWSVFQVWALGIDRMIYLLDQIRGKWESPELKRETIDFWRKWQAQPMGEDVPPPSSLGVEDKASGTGLIQQIQRETAIPINPIPRGPKENKLVRARSSAPSIEAGNVWLPDPDVHPVPWILDYRAEFASFTAAGSHKWDDQIDPTMDAIHDLILGKGNFYAGWL